MKKFLINWLVYTTIAFVIGTLYDMVAGRDPFDLFFVNVLFGILLGGAVATVDMVRTLLKKSRHTDN